MRRNEPCAPLQGRGGKQHRPHPRREAQKDFPRDRAPECHHTRGNLPHDCTRAQPARVSEKVGPVLCKNERHRPPLTYLLGLKLPSLDTQESAQGRTCRPSRALEGDMSDVCFHLWILLRVLDRVLLCHVIVTDSQGRTQRRYYSQSHVLHVNVETKG